jgi:NAD(P)-dependent dehydrogenase (short-subunit alcohol dehydrogenase family)
LYPSLKVFANAGISEAPFIPNTAVAGSTVVKPDFKTIDIDLIGALYTASLAIQHFRLQGVGKNGFRGKLICTSSVM